MMTDQEIRDLIAADTKARKLADAGNDTEAAARASEISAPVLVSRVVTELTLLADLDPDPNVAEQLLEKMEAVAEGNQLLKRTLKWLGPGSPGIDLGQPAGQAIVQILQDMGVFKADEAAAVKGLGFQRPTITPDQVARAWAEFRPNGRIQ